MDDEIDSLHREFEKWKTELRINEGIIETFIQAFKIKSEVVKELLDKRDSSEDQKEIKKIDKAFRVLEARLDMMNQEFKELLENRKEMMEDKDEDLGPLTFLLPEYEKELKSYQDKMTKSDEKKMQSKNGTHGKARRKRRRSRSRRVRSRLRVKAR